VQPPRTRAHVPFGGVDRLPEMDAAGLDERTRPDRVPIARDAGELQGDPVSRRGVHVPEEAQPRPGAVAQPEVDAPVVVPIDRRDEARIVDEVGG